MLVSFYAAVPLRGVCMLDVGLFNEKHHVTRLYTVQLEKQDF